MVLVVVIGGLLVLVLGAVTTVALYLGLLGTLGAVRLVRCATCGHWGWTSTTKPLRTCSLCRHDHLFHPILTAQQFAHSHHGHGHIRRHDEEGLGPLTH